MANKRRLTFEVPEELHTRLKAEAASLGVTLGSHCSAILDAGGSSPSPSIELDAATLRTLPLNVLREQMTEVTKSQPKDWRRMVALLNSEILRRHRI